MKSLIVAIAMVMALGTQAGAVPLSPGTIAAHHASESAVSATRVHHKPGHVGGRGLHKGWYKKNRGKHKGWRRWR